MSENNIIDPISTENKETNPPAAETSYIPPTFSAASAPSSPPPYDNKPGDKPKKQRKMKKGTRKILLLVLVGILIGAGIGLGGNYMLGEFKERMPALDIPAQGPPIYTVPGEALPEEESPIIIEEPKVVPTPEVNAEADAGEEEPKPDPAIQTPSIQAPAATGDMSPADVYEASVISTVGITTSKSYTNMWGYSSITATSGSGFVYSEDGYIITNYHVVKGAGNIKVSLYSEDEPYEAGLVGFDERLDLALLKIEAEGLVPVKIGNSDELRVGETVLAIGNPLGELTFSLTKGIVSALNREVTVSNGIRMKLIQTDCSINSGNSGGPLFNLRGELVGITNAKYSSSEGGASIDNIGFAIPINSVLSTVEQIIETGITFKPYIGVTVTTSGENSYGMPKGALIALIEPGSPAEKAGLELYDIITKVRDNNIEDSDDLVGEISECQVGDKITLTVYRKGEYIKITVTVGEKIQSVDTSS